jgi:aminoglycoside phosphotransferase (APT) family kinase protein
MTAGSSLTLACARAFPDRHDLGITGLTEINDGWECRVFAFDIPGMHGGMSPGDGFILRIYQGQNAAGKCEGEWTALSALNRAGFPVPAIVYRETEPGIDGQPFIVMERIPGPQLGSLLARSADDERTALTRRFCHLFAELHTLEWRPYVPNAEELEARDSVAHWLAMARPYAARYSIPELEPVLDWLEAHIGDVHALPPSVTHGDYHPWNVLCPSTHELVVIDWTSAEIQDYRFDLGWTLLLAQSSLGPAARDRILAEYEAARGAPVDGLVYFEVIAATRRIADILISLRYGAEAMGMRPGAEAMMTTGGDRHLRAAYQVLTSRTGLVLPAFAALL